MSRNGVCCFSTFLGYAVKTVFFELIGYRTERARRDPAGAVRAVWTIL